MSQLNFTCPKCSGNNIEEIMTDVVVASNVNEIHEGGDVDYGDQSNDGGYIDRFQCRSCGEIIKDRGQTIVTTENLYDYLDLNGMIKYVPTQKVLLSELLELCEDNEVMKASITKLFNKFSINP